MTDDPRARARRLLMVDIDGCSPKNTARYIEDLRACIYRLLAVVPPPPQEPKKEEEETRVDTRTDSPLPVTTAVKVAPNSTAAEFTHRCPVCKWPVPDDEHHICQCCGFHPGYDVTPGKYAWNGAWWSTVPPTPALVKAVAALDPPSPAPRQTADETERRLRELTAEWRRIATRLAEIEGEPNVADALNECADEVESALSALPTPREDRS